MKDRVQRDDNATLDFLVIIAFPNGPRDGMRDRLLQIGHSTVDTIWNIPLHYLGKANIVFFPKENQGDQLQTSLTSWANGHATVTRTSEGIIEVAVKNKPVTDPDHSFRTRDQLKNLALIAESDSTAIVAWIEHDSQNRLIDRITDFSGGDDANKWPSSVVAHYAKLKQPRAKALTFEFIIHRVGAMVTVGDRTTRAVEANDRERVLFRMYGWMEKLGPEKFSFKIGHSSDPTSNGFDIVVKTTSTEAISALSRYMAVKRIIGIP